MIKSFAKHVNMGLPLAPNGMPNVFYTKTKEGAEKLQSLLPRAIFRILHNTNISHLDPKSRNPSMHDLFPKMRQQIEALNPEAKIYASGGVIRSLLGYTYDRLLKEHLMHSGDREKITEDVLKTIIEEDTRHPIWSVLGPGSDWDGLVEGISKETALACLHPFALSNKENDRLTTLHYDINEYKHQMERACKQGGSSLDWIALSLHPDEGFRTPDNIPIISNFLQGRVAIFPMDQAEEPAVTTARITRTFLELPFLQPLPENFSLTEKAIQKLADNYRQLNESTLFKVKKQFHRAALNTRSAEACNFIALPNQRNTALEIAWRKIPDKLIPEFLDNQSIEERSDDFDPGNLRAKGLLIPVELFVSDFTNNGLLYHGTQKPINLLSMLRAGFYVSSTEQGTAVHGRGFYVTKTQEIAEGYSLEQGLIFPLALNQSRRIRILCRGQCPLEIIKEAQKKGQDLHKYLAETYSIDIIINTHILIQNSDAVIRPKDILQWIENLQKPLIENISQLAKSEKTPTDFLSKWRKFKNIDNISWMLYQTRPLETHLIKTLVQQLKNKDLDQETLNILSQLNLLDTPQFQEELIHQIKNIPELIQSQQKPLMDKISEFAASGTWEDEFWKICNPENILDKISWILYKTRPLKTHLIKTLVQELKNRDLDEKILNILSQLNLLYTPQFQEELIHQIKNIPELIRSQQKPSMDKISELAASRASQDEFWKIWNRENILDKISWILYKTRPLQTHLIKTLVSQLKNTDPTENPLDLENRLGLLHIPEFREEFIQQTHAVILHGSDQEVRNISLCADSFESHLNKYRNHEPIQLVGEEDPYRFIMSLLPHMTTRNTELIIKTIRLMNFATNTQLLDDITTYCLPLLEGKNSIQLRLAKHLVSYFHSILSPLSKQKLTLLFSKKAKMLFSSNDAQKIRFFVNETEVHEYNFSYWIPQDLYINFLNNSLNTFVNHPGKKEQLLCADILMRLMFIREREHINSGAVLKEKKPNISPQITKNLIQLLKQTPDLTAYSKIQELFELSSLDETSKDIFKAILVSIAKNPSSSRKTKKGANICLRAIDAP